MDTVCLNMKHEIREFAKLKRRATAATAAVVVATHKTAKQTFYSKNLHRLTESSFGPIQIKLLKFHLCIYKNFFLLHSRNLANDVFSLYFPMCEKIH